MLCVGVRLPWYQLGVAALVQDDVLGLEVPVDDSLLMQVAESHGDLSQVEAVGSIDKV